jgi:hypothetical protein
MREESSLRTQVADTVALLRARLPERWQIDAETQPPTDKGRPDAIIRVRSPDGAAADVVVEYKARLDPARVPMALEQLKKWPDAQPMLMAPFLSQGTRRFLRERGVSWADGTGNFRMVLDKPVVFIEIEGAAKNPFGRGDVPLKSLKGPSAAAVVRALCDYRPPYSLGQLAKATGLSTVSIFRVVDLLTREALVQKESRRGPVVASDWAGILRRWCEDYALLGSNRALSVLEPRGTDSLLEKLRTTDSDYALTASAVANRVAPVAPSRLIAVYAELPEALATDLGVEVVEVGANAQLVEPFSPVIMQRTERRDGLTCASLTQVVADLLTSPGRGPAEAEALIAWMRENEDEWRQTLST